MDRYDLLGTRQISVKEKDTRAGTKGDRIHLSQMKVIVWNMGGAFGGAASHEACWRYLADQDPEVALLQEAIPPEWAGERWEGLLAAPKWHGARVPWGSAIVTKKGPLTPVRPADAYWLQECWGGTVTARASAYGGLWLTSIHSKAESRHPSEFPKAQMAPVRLCHPEKVWEIEQVAADLAPLLAGQRFIAGGDLNSSLLFDAVYHRETNARLFTNLATAGFCDMRIPFYETEQRTFFKSRRREYQLDHVFSDRGTLGRATSWRVLEEAASELALSDHAPIEILIGIESGSRGPR